MSYLVLARKYRPQTFDEVVGQTHVTQTLVNAIQGGRVAHAMLFSGPRGTGKTTIARILAKAMNCDKGPTPTPCNACRSCLDITAGRGTDVFEIDGASNNSVDQVRELRDNSRYMPAHSRYKIYIIDEVHMLSIAAFNALLKTLEEPPEHVMFLFATTEAHKIPITILSRCQRHDLRRIALSAVVEHMGCLCRQESLSLSEANLWAIARQSGGSMRDALSLLDQILAGSDGELGDDDVRDLLGTMDRQVLFDLSEAVFARDIARVLEIIDTVFKTGQDLKRFYADLLMHFRYLMLIKMGVRQETLADLPPNDLEALGGQVAGVSLAFLDQVFSLLFGGETTVRMAGQPRLAIEMVFFKIHQITPALPIDVLIERMDSLLKNPSLTVAPTTAAPAGVAQEQADYGQAPPAPVSAPSSPEPQASIPSTPAQRESMGRIENQEPVGGSQDAWQQVIERVKVSKPSVAASLSRAEMVSESPEKFVVALSGNEYALNSVKKHQGLVETACREIGREIEIQFNGNKKDVSQVTAEKQKANELRYKLLNHPLVEDAVNIFRGNLEEVKINK